jgi:hypothetical protein
MKDKVKLRSDFFEVEDSLETVYEFVCEKRWGDGLPVIPPTKSRVLAMIEAANRFPDDVIAQLAPNYADATIEKIAINAVMAGCLPEHMPVLIAAVEAIAEPNFNLTAVQTTTNPAAVMVIVNGPIRHKLKINCRSGCLGPGWRSNATIGRALRFVLINIGGALPADVDKAIHGMPGKYSFCFGEDEEGSPWIPLHVERGYGASESTVTVTTIASTINSLTTSISKSETFLELAASAMATPGNNNILSGGGEQLLLMTGGHATKLSKDGFSKEECKYFLFELAKLPFSKLGDVWYPGKQLDQLQLKDGMLRPVKKPQDIIIVVAGGYQGYHHQVMHSFGDDSYSITKQIKEIDE